MGLFKRKRTDGLTWDGQGEERRGFIDRIKYNGEADELVWKFPHDNLSIGAQLVVNQSQEAVFFKDGMARDLFTAGTHTISASNIPVLQRLINLPFGGNTPFVAEVWYVNKTAKRGLKWGSATPSTVFDPLYRIELQIGAAGEFGVKIADSVRFITEIVGTLELTTTDDVVANFKAIINRKLSALINDYVTRHEVNFTQLPGKTDEASAFVREQIAGELAKYGVEVVQFDVERIVPIENEQLASAREIQRELTRQQRLGYTYQQERTFDVLEAAANNEGSAAGQMMGAGLGLGMGVGVGGAFGGVMGEMAGEMKKADPTKAPEPPSEPDPATTK
jgi:membrane protease subunit (stomatin/prohibitin family)